MSRRYSNRYERSSNIDLLSIVPLRRSSPIAESLQRETAARERIMTSQYVPSVRHSPDLYSYAEHLEQIENRLENLDLDLDRFSTTYSNSYNRTTPSRRRQSRRHTALEGNSETLVQNSTQRSRSDLERRSSSNLEGRSRSNFDRRSRTIDSNSSQVQDTVDILINNARQMESMPLQYTNSLRWASSRTIRASDGISTFASASASVATTRLGDRDQEDKIFEADLQLALQKSLSETTMKVEGVSSAHSSETAECPICFENFEKGNDVFRRCGHRFHSKCDLKWTKARGVLATCPICRM